MSTTDGRRHTHSPVQLSRAQILKATARCLDRWGYDGTTIRRIAAELNCAVGSIYRYCRDKRDLMYAVAQRLLDPVAIAAEADQSPQVCEQLYLRQAQTAPQVYHLMFWLASVVEEHASSDGRALPAVVERTITAWSKSLGQDQAQLRWARLHAAITLGQSNVRTSPMSPQQAIISALTPLPPQSTPDHAPVEAEKGGREGQSAEDVCLL